MAAPSKRQAQRAATHARLLAASLDVFREQGVANARIEDITKRAGVSRASFYFHFPTKDHVIEAVRIHAEQGLSRAIASLPDEASLEDLFTCVAKNIGDRWEDDPKMFIEVGILSLRRTIDDVSTSVGVREQVASHFERAAEQGIITSLVPSGTASDLYLMHVLVASVGWCHQPQLPLTDALRLAGHLFLNGLVAR